MVMQMIYKCLKLQFTAIYRVNHWVFVIEEIVNEWLKKWFYGFPENIGHIEKKSKILLHCLLNKYHSGCWNCEVNQVIWDVFLDRRCKRANYFWESIYVVELNTHTYNGGQEIMIVLVARCSGEDRDRQTRKKGGMRGALVFPSFLGDWTAPPGCPLKTEFLHKLFVFSVELLQGAACHSTRQSHHACPLSLSLFPRCG